MTVKRGVGRKSQISIFLILSLALILLIMLTIFSKQAILGDLKQQQRAQFQGQFDSRALEQYVNYCLTDSADKIAYNLGVWGGTMNSTELMFNSKHYLGQDFRLLCISIPGAKGCINRVFTLNELENEFSDATLRTLDKCIDFNYFKQRGYNVTQGKPKLNVKISPSLIKFTLDYDLSFEREGVVISSANYYAEVKHPIGSAYMIAQDIINHEASDSGFDKDKWMNQNNLFFKIEKLSPYPYVIYKLTSNDKFNYTFQFSLLHEDSASNINQEYGYELEYGCCYVGSGCFKNSDYKTCVLKGGTYEPHSGCSCGANLAYDLNLDEDNANFVNQKKSCMTKKDGESWCINQDGVGSVDRKLSCHDGKIYVENCRDYHEEACVEFSEKNLTSAVCKPNRWKDCTKCDNKECCLNDILRDCVWDEKNYSVISESYVPSCLPKIPPGFKFWDSNSQDVCNLGTRVSICNGPTCGQTTVQHFSDICSMLGDCGFKPNYQSFSSKSGFFETDPLVNPIVFKQERPFVSLNEKQVNLVSPKSKDTISLLPGLISAWLDYLAKSANNKKTTIDFSFCNLWQPPYGYDCKSCGIGTVCSEYRCKSISQECYYHEEDGFPKCDPKPKKQYDMQIGLLTNLTFVRTSVNVSGNTLIGYELNNPYQPFKEISFRINTSEKSKCKITYLPDVGFVNSPAVWFGNPIFSKIHEVKMRLPDKITIPAALQSKLDILSMLDLYQMIINDDKKLSKTFDQNTLKSLKKMSQELSKRPYLRELLRLSISSLENNTYYLFLRCADETGVENKNPVFLKFNVDNSLEDTEAPIIVGFEPQNGSIVQSIPYLLKVYVNEPADCRISPIDQAIYGMPSEMDCKKSNIMGYEAGGSFSCSINTSIKNPYIRCIDNPSQIKTYSLHTKIITGNVTPDLMTNSQFIVAGMESTADEYDLIDNDAVLAFNNSIAVTRFSLVINGDYSCSYTVGYLAGAIPNDMDCYSSDGIKTICSEMLSAGNYNLTFNCNDNHYSKRNPALSSLMLNYSTSGSLSIINYYPMDSDKIGNLADFSVFVNKNIDDNNIECGYAIDGSLEYLSMNKLGNYQFKKQSLLINNGLHQVNFKCRDSTGIEISKKVIFSVE